MVSRHGLGEGTDAGERGGDAILPFSIENTNVRGRIVRLGPALDAALANHDYAEPVSILLGEALAMAVLLGSSIKLDGKLILQVQGDGPVSMLVADYRSEGHLRGYAQVNADRPRDPDTASFRDLVGEGYFAITLDPRRRKDRYQGIVALTGTSLADCAKAYFDQSEQVPTEVRLGVARRLVPGGASTWRAGGILLQSLPDAPTPGGDAARRREDWATARLLLSSLEIHELVDPQLTSEQVLYRLFHESGVRVYTPQPLSFSCSCDGDEILRLLASFPVEERVQMVEDDGRIHVRCEFCGTSYAFEPAAVRSQNPEARSRKPEDGSVGR